METKQTNQVVSQFTQFAVKDPEQISADLQTSLQNGLSTAQLAKQWARYGQNMLTAHEVTLWQIFWNQIKSPFIYLLIIIGFINIFLGEYTEGIIIFLLVAINTAFSFYQEYRTHNALALLQKYITDTIRVIRNGQEMAVASNKLVPGDIVKLYPGDVIPADMRFITAENLMVDESALTGESVPVAKNAQTIKTADPITVFNATNIGFKGTSISSGKALGLIFAIGNTTYFGSIATVAQQSPKQSSFTLGLARFSRFILYLVLITVTFVFLVHFFLNPHFNALNLLIFSMALGITIIPEALPIVITFSLTRGALKLAKQKLVIKRLSAIEDLGSMDILCTDKTGTLTENHLTIKNSFASDEKQLWWYAALSSGLSVSSLEKDTGFNGPVWHQLSEQEQASYKNYRIIAEHPFESVLRYGSLVVAQNTDAELILRGNVQEVIALCSDLDASQKAKITQWAQAEGNLGRRVLAFAAKKTSQEITHIDTSLEKDLQFIGLISYEDPIKITAYDALAKARALGVEVKIISGDSKEVNRAIGNAIKLIDNESQIISGEELKTKTEAQKDVLIEQCKVFAHIVPDQKVEIVKQLEIAHDIGYVGDGINDAPALKAAHVSMAVDTAEAVARDVADIILLNKSLHVIVNGIREGRIIFANMIKYIKSTLTANFGHFYSLSVISLLIDYLPLQPSQLLLISLLTDIPLIAISTDTVSFNDIKRPKKYDLKDIALVTMTLALFVMITDFIIFALFHNEPHSVLQTNWFITCILVELSFFYSIRTTLPFYKGSFPSWPVLSLSFLIAALSIALPYTALGQKYLHFTPPSAHHLALIALVTFVYFIITDLVKVLYYRLYSFHKLA